MVLESDDNLLKSLQRENVEQTWFLQVESEMQLQLGVQLHLELQPVKNRLWQVYDCQLERECWDIQPQVVQVVSKWSCAIWVRDIKQAYQATSGNLCWTKEIGMSWSTCIAGSFWVNARDKILPGIVYAIEDKQINQRLCFVEV